MIIDKIAPKILKNSFDIAADKISKFSEQIDKSRKVCYSRVSTNPLVPLEQDMFELSKECQFVKMLNSHFKKVPITVSVEGKSYTWNKYIDSQMGSQDAFWARNESTGELFYVKFAKNKVKEGHIDSEIKASKLYNLAGISTPEIKPITINGKIKGLASKYVANLKEPTNPKMLHSAFAVDAWLANWDSVLFGNTLIKDGKLYKVDNGGALKYRAMGELKPNFGDEVEEIISLVDGRNTESKNIYASITHEELVNSFKRVCNISDSDIKNAVDDTSLAQTLINRKIYMKKVLVELEKRPIQNEDLAQYLSRITKLIYQDKIFNSDAVLKNLSMRLEAGITNNGRYVYMPSTKTLAKEFIKEIKQLEKDGFNLSRENIIDLLQKILDNGLDIKPPQCKGSINSVLEMEKQYNKMFLTLLHIAEKTPQKDSEDITSYLKKIVRRRELRTQQLEDFRIKNIKSKLKYDRNTVVSEDNYSLTGFLRAKAISELQIYQKRYNEADVEGMSKLSAEATDMEIYEAWQQAHLGGFIFSNRHVQLAVMNLGGRYSAKHPIKTKSFFETIAEKNYKQDFDIEPVYHWFRMANSEDFVINVLPKKGDVYTLKDVLCCSTHKHYAEMGYGDHVVSQNIKFIIHPKSEISRAYNLGYNQEVIYPSGEQFRILDKDCVEYIDKKTGFGRMLWEVHIQEV